MTWSDGCALSLGAQMWLAWLIPVEAARASRGLSATAFNLLSCPCRHLLFSSPTSHFPVSIRPGTPHGRRGLVSGRRFTTSNLLVASTDCFWLQSIEPDNTCELDSPAYGFSGM